MLRATPFALLLALGAVFVAPASQAQSTSPAYACVVTNIGEFCMKFLRENAPNTVNNFLKYVDRGAYDQTFIHRSERSFVVQGGGYRLDPLGEAIPEDAPVQNEFSASNVRGTVAMAKFPDQPDSATNEWFVNVGDNSAYLDINNGGFTVFARIARGMRVVDTINQFGLVDLTGSLGGVFGSVPVLRKDPDGVDLDDLVQVIRVYTTDTVEEEPIDDNSAAEEAARLYQCVADWVQEVSPREVCMDTNIGGFCMDLMPEVASKTVANFLHYVADGDYNNTIIHRNVPGFVVQGGGFRLKPAFTRVPSDPAVANEYGTPNTRGTVALAKPGNSPDGGTSEWFVNLADNSETLNANNNGGFTVFARVREADMGIFDTIGNLGTRDLYALLGGSPQMTAFSEVPLRRTEPEDNLTLDDFIIIKRAYIPGHETNPCIPVKPPAVTEYASRAFLVPVRMADGKIYEFRFNQDFTEPGIYRFTPQMYSIRELKDLGQEVAEYSASEKVLRIPSVLTPGNHVIYNVVLRLSHPSTLSFTVEDFDLEPGSPQ